MDGITQARSRQIGRALTALAVLKLLLGLRMARRMPAVLAVPFAVAVALASTVLFWIGTTLAVKDWDDPADWPPRD